MATIQETMQKMEEAAVKYEAVADAGEQVLISEGEQDIPLPDGTTTPNLNKRIANTAKAVSSVNGKTGNVVVTREDLGLKSDEMMARDTKEDRFVITESGRTQREKNKETPSPLDYKAKGNIIDNDTQAFVDLEMENNNQVVDLLGKTYKVDRDFTKNKYINGSFDIASNIKNAGLCLPIYYDVTYTVGNDADFKTMNEALLHASISNFKAYSKGGESISTGFKPDNLNIQILLKSGFVMQEQVIARQVDLSFITLTSEDNVVQIDRSALTECTYFKGTTSEMYPAFYFGDSSDAPLFACLFEMDKTGTATNRHGIVVCRNSSIHVAPHCGVKGSGGNGLFLREGSYGSARLSNFSYSEGDGISVAAASNLDAHGGQVNNSYNGVTCYSSNLDIERGVINNCVQDAIVADSTATVNAQLSNCDSSGRYGVRCHGGSSVFFINSTAKNCGSYGVYAYGASTIVGTGADISNSAYGFRAIDASTLSINNAKAQNCGRGVILTDCSKASAKNIDVSGYVEFGISVNQLSSINADSAICGTEAKTTDLVCSNGSSIYARNSTGGTSVVVNQYTTNGIIIK